MKSKTTKSITKRIRITGNGKIVRRPMGVNHFRTRKSAKNVQSKRKTLSLGISTKSILNY
jgi:ribosomal protein L35